MTNIFFKDEYILDTHIAKCRISWNKAVLIHAETTRSVPSSPKLNMSQNKSYMHYVSYPSSVHYRNKSQKLCGEKYPKIMFEKKIPIIVFHKHL